MRPSSNHVRPNFLRPNLARLLASAAVTAILAASLGGCQTMSDVTGGLTQKSSAAAPASPDDPRRDVEVYGERYRANPKDAEAALAYGQALRASGQRSQAAAVLEQATIAHPGNKALLAGYGRALAENGNSQAAFDVLAPRPFARQSGLAHPVGAGHGARQARQARRSPPLLHHRAEDRAGRTLRTVESRPVLHADARTA